MENKVFGKLDTNSPEDIEEMERLLEEKYEANKKASDGKKVTA